MQDLNDKVTGGSLTAPEWNEVPSELQNVIEGTGIALSGADLNQLGKAIAGYVGSGNFYTDTGTANAYVLAATGLKQAPPAYATGQRIRYEPANANTGASTVNLAGLGVKDLQVAGQALPAAYLAAGVEVEAVYDGTAFQVVVDRNPNQASTAQGGTGASDGANTWAKLAEFTLTTENSAAALDFVLLDTFSNAKNHLRFTVTLYATTVYDNAGIVITQNTTPSIIANDGIKLVASSTALGTSVGIWVNKLTTNKRFELKELAKANVSSITYITNAPWQAADPTAGPPAFLVSSAVGGFASIGVDQTWQILTTGRAYGPTFTNGTGQSIMVVVRGSATSTGEPYITVDGVSIFGTTVGAGINSVVTAVVPNGGEYSSGMTNGTATLNRWLELRK